MPRPSTPNRKIVVAPANRSRLPRNGTPKMKIADGHGDGDIDDPDHEIGKQLAEYDLDAADRRRGELLHRSALPLTCDGERSQHRRDDRHDHGDEAGHDHHLAVERLVVPHPRLGAKRWSHVARPDTNARREVAGNAVGVATSDGGGLCIAAVEQQLDRRAAPRRQIGREAFWNHQGDAHQSAVNELAQLAFVRWRVADGEVARSGECGDECAALRRLIAIEHRDLDVLDVRRERVAEQQQEHEWQQERERETSLVPLELDQLLSRYGAQARKAEQRVSIIRLPLLPRVVRERRRHLPGMGTRSRRSGS